MIDILHVETYSPFLSLYAFLGIVTLPFGKKLGCLNFIAKRRHMYIVGIVTVFLERTESVVSYK